LKTTVASQSWASSFLRDSVRFLVYVFYCIEGGLFLLLTPWSALWSQNFFFERVPLLGALASFAVVRGLVSGLGLALLLHGVEEIVAATQRTRHRSREPRDGGRA